MDDDSPIGAFILTLIGGILILLAGAYLAIAGGFLAALGNSALGGLAQGLGDLGVFLGFLLVLLSIGLLLQPEHHLAYGVVVIVLSLMSAVAGAGFFLGLVLGVIGGILAIIYEGSEEEDLPLGPLAPASAGRTCPNCHEWVTAKFRFCPQCGSPMP